MATEPRIVECKAFNDCQEIGDRFKANQVVDMSLSLTSEQDARRLEDFASGLVYAAGGTMERIGPEHFRLIPPTPPDTGKSGEREPRNPKPVAGADGAVVPVVGREVAGRL